MKDKCNANNEITVFYSCYIEIAIDNGKSLIFSIHIVKGEFP